MSDDCQKCASTLAHRNCEFAGKIKKDVFYCDAPHTKFAICQYREKLRIEVPEVLKPYITNKIGG